MAGGGGRCCFGCGLGFAGVVRRPYPLRVLLSTLGYFGVFLVAPLTAALLGALAAALLVGALVVALGLDAEGAPWRIIAVPLAALTAVLGALGTWLRWRLMPPLTVRLDRLTARVPVHVIGAKAQGLGGACLLYTSPSPRD